MSNVKPRVVNAADELQVSEARELEMLDQRQGAEDLRTMLRDDAGARFILRILGLCAIDDDHDFGENTHMAARAAGVRSVGVQLMQMIYRDAPAEWLEVLQAKHRAEMKERRSK